MSQLTVFLAQLIGLFTVLLVGVLLIRGSTIIEARLLTVLLCLPTPSSASQSVSR
jgi:hypothetical protein